jgi:glycine/D-amino acid oxidase-like deaminating enzyme
LPSAHIIGAGVFGAWVAHALMRRGWKVRLSDQHGPANSRASSGGETRIIRSGYGPLSLYSRWARQSLPEWLELERRAGERLFVRTGALFLGGASVWLQDTMRTLAAQGVPVRWLARDDFAVRYPQLSFPDTAGAVLEPEAGVLFARRAVQRLVALLIQDGVSYEQRAVEPHALIHESRADAIVFACGPWLPTLFPDVLRNAIFPTRQEVFFFGAPGGDARFSAESCPAWVAFDEGVYGLPDLEHRGVKIAFDAHGEDADPERMERNVSAASVARMRDVLRQRIPALADAPLLEARVCQYENTSNGHLLIDRLPGDDRVWIAGGGSGHGFKHGPAVGAYLVDLIDGSGVADPTFALAGRPPRARAVF